MKHKVLLFISFNIVRDNHEIEELMEADNYEFNGVHDDGTASFTLEIESSVKMAVGDFFFDDVLSYKVTRAAYIIDFSKDSEGVSYMCDYVPENLML